MLGLANAWCRKLEEEEMKEEKERRKRKRTKKRMKRMKRRTKRTKRTNKRKRRGGEGRGGGGGGSLSKISSEETLSKLRLKLNQNKAKSTKHAGRPADLRQRSDALGCCPGLYEQWCFKSTSTHSISLVLVIGCERQSNFLVNWS